MRGEREREIGAVSEWVEGVKEGDRKRRAGIQKGRGKMADEKEMKRIQVLDRGKSKSCEVARGEERESQSHF